MRNFVRIQVFILYHQRRTTKELYNKAILNSYLTTQLLSPIQMLIDRIRFKELFLL